MIYRCGLLLSLICIFGGCHDAADGFVTPSLASLRRDTATTAGRPWDMPQTALGVSKKAEVAMKSNNYLRGKITVFLMKFCVSPAKAYSILRMLIANTYWPEVGLIVAMNYAMEIAQWTYRIRPKHRGEEEEVVQASFNESKSKKLAWIFREVGQLQAALYISDIVCVILKQLDFQFIVKHQMQKVAGSTLFALWLATNISRAKYLWLRKGKLSVSSIWKKKPTPVPAEVLEDDLNISSRFANSVLDVIIYLSAFLTIIDLLGIQIGFALKSVFGIGSFGTLVISLGSKDLAAEFVGGLMIQTSNFFDEGETVILQDGTRGEVVKIGWLHTYIKRDDDYVVRVPNSQISHNRIARQAKRKRKAFLGPPKKVV